MALWSEKGTGKANETKILRFQTRGYNIYAVPSRRAGNFYGGADLHDIR